jgi:hypothetical protein
MQFNMALVATSSLYTELSRPVSSVSARATARWARQGHRSLRQLLQSESYAAAGPGPEPAIVEFKFWCWIQVRTLPVRVRQRRHCRVATRQRESPRPAGGCRTRTAAADGLAAVAAAASAGTVGPVTAGQAAPRRPGSQVSLRLGPSVAKP